MTLAPTTLAPTRTRTTTLWTARLAGERGLVITVEDAPVDGPVEAWIADASGAIVGVRWLVETVDDTALSLVAGVLHARRELIEERLRVYGPQGWQPRGCVTPLDSLRISTIRHFTKAWQVACG